MLRPCSVLSLTTLVACFGPATPEDAPRAAAPVAIALRDPQGARYPSETAPRDLTLTLRFAAAPPPSPPVRLWRGDVHVALADALGARGDARLAGLLVPLRITPAAAALTLTPEAPLLPGARYTLVWGEGDAGLTFPLDVSNSPALGAAAVGTWPGDGARAVPRNLARAWVRFDGELAADDATLAAHVIWRGPTGADVPSQLLRAPCVELGLSRGTCVARTPSGPLVAGAHTLVALSGITTLTGAPIAPLDTGFTVDDRDDATPPALVPEDCEDDELPRLGACVLLGDRTLGVRGRVGEPAEVTLLPTPCAVTTHDGAFAIDDCARDPAIPLTLRLRDLAGHERALPLDLPPPPTLARVSIDEVRADPRGKEPAQEYIELLSSSPHPVSLMGFTLRIDRDRARTVTGSPTLRPGERTLLVGPDFDPADARDGTLPPGIALVRLDRALGLSNQGARLVLHDAAGRRVSSAASLAPLLEGQCSARRSADPRAGGAEHFARDPDGGCTPGQATFERP